MIYFSGGKLSQVNRVTGMNTVGLLSQIGIMNPFLENKKVKLIIWVWFLHHYQDMILEKQKNLGKNERIQIKEKSHQNLWAHIHHLLKE